MEETGKLGLTEEDVKRAGKEITGLLGAMGDEHADAAAIVASEDGKIIAQRMKVMDVTENSQASKDYWANYEKGLRKEVHGNGLDKWSSFVPLAAEREPERRFPLIFCLHGAHNPIQLTESYGVMQVAAREECVVIAPENENWENIQALLQYSKEHFPVDESRVYLMGYSFGGFMSSRNGLAHPEVFAGIAMGGMLFAGKVRAHQLDDQAYPAYELTEEMLQKAERLEVPALLFMGENEMLRLLPLWKEPVPDIRDGVIPLESKDKRQAFNNWRRVGGCGPAEFLEQDEEGDLVEQRIGAHFERTVIREYLGRRYFVGDSVNSQGECLFRTVAAENMVHWPTPAFAELAWEHLSKFARDLETKKLKRLD